MKKNPWVAAILNLVIIGAGYIYVGNRVFFGTLLIILDLWSFTWLFTDPLAEQLMSNGMLLLAGFLWMFAFAYDAYQDAKSVNKK